MHRRIRFYSVQTEIDASKQLTANGYIETTSILHIANTAEMPKWPIYRILGPNGKLIGEEYEKSNFNQKNILEQYRIMCRIQALDDIFYNAQRQGRISFYMQNIGEEATHIGESTCLI